MWNKTEINSPSSDMSSFFIVGWNGVNGTQFVKATNALDYETSTVETAIALYKSGTASEKMKNLILGDVISAKIRNSEKYALIKITHIELVGSDKNFGNNKTDNDDFIKFKYKVGTK